MRTKKFSIHIFLLVSCFVMLPRFSFAQKKEKIVAADSSQTIAATIDSNKTVKKTKKVRDYSPAKAATRSALIPGWGQVYNKKYWKVPIVYGALGTTAAIFFFNLETYQDTRLAYNIKYNMSKPGATAADSARYDEIPDYLKPISEGSLRSYRDSYRRDLDYSVIFFLLFWGLNVVDAAVDAHLKSFDVSPDLSLRFKPGYSEMAGTNGISLVLSLDKKKQPPLMASRF